MGLALLEACVALLPLLGAGLGRFAAALVITLLLLRGTARAGGVHDSQLRIDYLALLAEARHSLAQVKVFKMGARLRIYVFLLLLALIDSLEVLKVDIVDI